MNFAADDTPIFNPADHGIYDQPSMVSAAAYYKAVAERAALLEALKLYVCSVADHGLPMEQLAAWEAARAAIAKAEGQS